MRSDSTWNNPVQAIILIDDSNGRAVRATLGNDVNLRDFEGRSALLLGKAKNNNASCALGPFIRLFDESFTIDDVRSAEVEFVIEGRDHYRLEGVSSMKEISRDPLELMRQALSEHDYPDSFTGQICCPRSRSRRIFWETGHRDAPPWARPLSTIAIRAGADRPFWSPRIDRPFC